MSKGIDLVGVSCRGQTATFEEPGDSAGDAPDHAVHLPLAGRRKRPKAHFVLRVIDAVEHQCVEVNVEVERAAESLHEGHGPALRILDGREKTRRNP